MIKGGRKFGKSILKHFLFFYNNKNFFLVLERKEEVERGREKE